MKSINLTDSLRYISLEDDVGTFGLFVRHNGDEVTEVIEVNNYDEFVATMKSFQIN